MADDRYLQATLQYLYNRHDIALRLLAECDKEAAVEDRMREETLRDEALSALVRRDYAAAAAATAQLAASSEQTRRVTTLRRQLRLECDRLCAARELIEQRELLLQGAPAGILDPAGPESVGASLQRRHDITLRLIAAIDAELAGDGGSGAGAAKLRDRRARLSMELDLLLAALQAHAHKEELLDSASGVLGEGTPDTGAYLRRALAYLEARSSIVLRLVAYIDERLVQARTPYASPCVASLVRSLSMRARVCTQLDGAASPVSVTETSAEQRAALRSRRQTLLAELDAINAQVEIRSAHC